MLADAARILMCVNEQALCFSQFHAALLPAALLFSLRLRHQQCLSLTLQLMLPHPLCSSAHRYDVNPHRRWYLPIDASAWPATDLALQLQMRSPDLAPPADDVTQSQRMALLQQRLPSSEWFHAQDAYLSSLLDPLHRSDSHRARPLWRALNHWQTKVQAFAGLLMGQLPGEVNEQAENDDAKMTRQAVQHINAALLQAPEISNCVVFHGIPGALFDRAAAESYVFAGAQQWCATSYDFAVATKFAGEGGVVLAIHIDAARALWVSSHLVEATHDSSALHEREVMLRITGKSMQPFGEERIVDCGEMLPYKLRVRTVRLVSPADGQQAQASAAAASAASNPSVADVVTSSAAAAPSAAFSPAKL
jgi:hypothetical protein